MAVAVSSGTAALHLAYLAAGVGPGDEVVVPSYTFVATVAAVLHCGATPVFADIIGAEDLSLDPESVRLCLSTRTKAVTCVHFAGYAAPADRLSELCADHGVALIEDAAHAPSGTLNGRRLGAWGKAAAFSLFSNKVLAVSLPRTEDASSREITIPLFAHMSDEQLDRVMRALEAEVPR
jgi:dTDP-4-amino-4,6-dideoxygalactose transaminase